MFKLVQPKITALMSYWYFSGNPDKADFEKIVEDLTFEPLDEPVDEPVEDEKS